MQISLKLLFRLFSYLQYGKQLRENYRAFKNKNTEHLSPKESYNSGVNIQSVSSFFFAFIF